MNFKLFLNTASPKNLKKVFGPDNSVINAKGVSPALSNPQTPRAFPADALPPAAFARFVEDDPLPDQPTKRDVELYLVQWAERDAWRRRARWACHRD